jgi:hypothetical protein
VIFSPLRGWSPDFFIIPGSANSTTGYSTLPVFFPIIIIIYFLSGKIYRYCPRWLPTSSKTRNPIERIHIHDLYLPPAYLDDSIFLTTTYKYEVLAARLRELAFLNSGIRLTLIDERIVDEDGNYKSEVFYSEDGLKEFVEYLDDSRVSLIPEVINISTQKAGIPVEIALQYNSSYSEKVHSYVNNNSGNLPG